MAASLIRKHGQLNMAAHLIRKHGSSPASRLFEASPERQQCHISECDLQLLYTRVLTKLIPPYREAQRRQSPTLLWMGGDELSGCPRSD